MANTDGVRSGIAGASGVRVESLDLATGAYRRLSGRLIGRVATGEAIAGLMADCAYDVEFELVHPLKPAADGVLLVEAENRGAAIYPALLDDTPVKLGGPPSANAVPFGTGGGFLLDGRRSYARVQWQQGIAGGVPEGAQGVGQAIVRDFGRMLGSLACSHLEAPVFAHRILAGASQSAWFVNAFIAEGFNADPVTGGRVFQAAITRNGAGNWLAINGLGKGTPQRPYPLPEAAPLKPGELLRRPTSDPLLVDIAEYTDFYRVRAGWGAEDTAPNLRRYDWPSAHATASLMPDAVVFGQMKCNDGQAIARNGLDCRPYLRALLAGLEGEITGGKRRLPASACFQLEPGPPTSPFFNGLAGLEVKTPVKDAQGQPVGGVRFPELDYPLGRLEPPSLSPCDLASINSLCGNFGGFAPFASGAIAARYWSADRYVAQVRASLVRLAAAGYLLERDLPAMLQAARAAYEASA